MREQAEINKTAWDFLPYESWINKGRGGWPAEEAARIKANPTVGEYHQKYFADIAGKKIANPLGSNGRMAVPLALSGAEVTVFDISEENKRYALELAKEAGVMIEYVLGDFCETDISRFGEKFDIVFAEGGVLHFFLDINEFMRTIFAITKPGGQLVLSDFHPAGNAFTRWDKELRCRVLSNVHDYFDPEPFWSNVPYHLYFPEEEQAAFPKTLVRFHTMSGIINAVINSGFVLKEFTEHPTPHSGSVKYPSYFTIIAHKDR